MVTVIMILRVLTTIFNVFVVGFTVMWYLEANHSKAKFKTMLTMIAFSMLNIAFAWVPNLSNLY